MLVPLSVQAEYDSSNCRLSTASSTQATKQIFKGETDA